MIFFLAILKVRKVYESIRFLNIKDFNQLGKAAFYFLDFAKIFYFLKRKEFE